jgi:hypothetical protein
MVMRLSIKVTASVVPCEDHYAKQDSRSLMHLFM